MQLLSKRSKLYAVITGVFVSLFASLASAANFADAATALTGGADDVKAAGAAVLGLVVIVTVFGIVFSMAKRG